MAKISVPGGWTVSDANLVPRRRPGLMAKVNDATAWQSVAADLSAS